MPLKDAVDIGEYVVDRFLSLFQSSSSSLLRRSLRNSVAGVGSFEHNDRADFVSGRNGSTPAKPRR